MCDEWLQCWLKVWICGEGLKSHVQYELARTQMRGYSGMVTFYIRGAEDEARSFLRNLKVMTTVTVSPWIASVVLNMETNCYWEISN